MSSRSKGALGGTSRSYEHDLRSPSPAFDDSGAQPEKTRRYVYERLVSVGVRNGFYNSSDGVCSDFTFQPTATTASLMKSLGLLLRTESDGFSVLFDQAMESSLLSYLRRRLTDGEDGSLPGVWTRLSFVLVNHNPYFVNFSEIPIRSNPSQVNFYFNNQEAHAADPNLPDSPTWLTPDDRVTANELLPVVGTQVQVPVSESVETVEVISISDEVVLSESALGKSRVYLDFSSLPEGKYRIINLKSDGSFRGQTVLYTSFQPMPLAFVDLFFTDPTDDGPGVFPVRQLLEPSETEIVPTFYELHFAERSVEWIYYIVPEASASAYDQLEIRSDSNPTITFSGPEKVKLANGSRAFRFASEETLALFRVSPFRFQLWGRRSPEPESQILIPRLPVASPQAIDPGTACSGAACSSSIYVYL